MNELGEDGAHPTGGRIRLGANRYGKAEIRLVRVHRHPGRHEVKDLTVRVALEGDFEAIHASGDNGACIATDTMKNTALAYARDHLAASIEAYGVALARHFLEFDQVSRSTVSVEEHRWTRIVGADGASDHAFFRTGDFARTATIAAARGEPPAVEAGIRDLTLLKTTHSAFSGFDRDRFTTLAETDDRLLATKLSARWRYRTGLVAAAGLDFDAAFDGVLAILLDVFARHDSPSVQSTIWQLGEAILAARSEIEEISFELPNLHHWPVDLSPFGMTNDREVYVATSEPRGVIEATIRRD